MRKYIVNLTSHLIRTNHYDEIFDEIGNQNEFIRHIKFDLLCGDVRKMSAETLGKIMCSFEIGDVIADKNDLFNGVSFGGNCEEMLRELVCLCLAYAIYQRHDEDRLAGTGVPSWTTPRTQKRIEDLENRRNELS